MRRTSARALLAAAALGIATIAFPLAAAAQSASDYQTCDDVPGFTKIDQASGDHDGAWGTISWGGNTLDFDLEVNWTLDVCLKAGNEVTVTTGHTGTGSVETPDKQEISHIGHRLVFEEPSDDGADDDGADGDDGEVDADGTDDGTDDGVGSDDGEVDADGTDDGVDDGVGSDDGEADAGGTDDGADDGVGSDDGEVDGDGTDDGDGVDADGVDADGDDGPGAGDDGVEVLPDVQVPADEDDDGDVEADGGDVEADGGDVEADGGDDDGSAVEVLPATLDRRLPTTGSDLLALAVVAALALGLGGGSLLRTRRRVTTGG